MRVSHRPDIGRWGSYERRYPSRNMSCCLSQGLSSGYPRRAISGPPGMPNRLATDPRNRSSSRIAISSRKNSTIVRFAWATFSSKRAVSSTSPAADGLGLVGASAGSGGVSPPTSSNSLFLGRGAAATLQMPSAGSRSTIANRAIGWVRTCRQRAAIFDRADRRLIAAVAPKRPITV